MNTVLAAGLLLCLAVSPLVSHAQALTLKTQEGAEIGLQVSTYRYEEVVDNTTFMDTKGRKMGVTASGTHVLDEQWRDWFVTVEGSYVAGTVNYEGSGTLDGSMDDITVIRVTAGRDISYARHVASYFAGLGRRSLFNDLRGTTSTGASGYRRESTYYYLPLGVTLRLPWTSQARVATTLEYDYLIRGQQVSYTTDYGEASDLHNTQRRGYGIRLGTAYETALWSAGVFYNYWNIADSDTATAGSLTGYEPKNTTKEFGIQIKYRFY